jgi:microcystin-dependent protein
MDNRVWASGAAASPPIAPASPSVGYPSPGDPLTATPASKGGAFWFHQLGEELRAVLTAAGITPDHEDLTQVLTAMQTLFSPRSAGAIQFYAMSTAPSGWLKANGAAVSRTTYATLFNAIGTVFGVGDGATTFNLPDLRGEFLRGWDDARGVDTGRAFGSAQADEFKSHTHSINDNEGPSQSNGALIYGALSPQPPNANTNATGGAETRPRNIALLACIKY